MPQGQHNVWFWSCGVAAFLDHSCVLFCHLSVSLLWSVSLSGWSMVSRSFSLIIFLFLSHSPAHISVFLYVTYVSQSLSLYIYIYVYPPLSLSLSLSLSLFLSFSTSLSGPPPSNVALSENTLGEIGLVFTKMAMETYECFLLKFHTPPMCMTYQHICSEISEQNCFWIWSILVITLVMMFAQKSFEMKGTSV